MNWKDLMTDPGFKPGDYADLLPMSAVDRHKYKVARKIREAMAYAQSRGCYLNVNEIARITCMSPQTVNRYLKTMGDVMPYLTYSRKYRLTAKGHKTHRSQRLEQ